MHDSRPRLKTAVLAVLVTIVAVPGTLVMRTAPAHASGGGDGSVVGDSIEAQVRYDDPGDTGNGCSWTPSTGVDPLTGTTYERGVTRIRDGVREVLYERNCPDAHSLHWVRDDTAPRIAAHAESRVSRIVPALLARTAPPHDKMVVNVGTWFWVPSAVWKPISVTAFIVTPAGPITVTVTARPSRLLFSPGDGKPSASCRGPGTPWRRSIGDLARSACMYTYRRASHVSDSGEYRARMSVRWNVSWTSNLGVGSPLPSITTGFGLRAVVRELQALSH